MKLQFPVGLSGKGFAQGAIIFTFDLRQFIIAFLRFRHVASFRHIKTDVSFRPRQWSAGYK